MADSLKTQFADLLAEGKFEGATDVQEQMILAAIRANESQRQPNQLQLWLEGNRLERGRLRRLLIAGTAMVLLVLAVAVTLRGRDFRRCRGPRFSIERRAISVQPLHG
jgi:hypothetical protein